MKILIAADGSVYTKRMLAYLAAHDEWLGSKHSDTHIASWSRQPALAPCSRLGLAEWVHRHGVSVTQHVHESTANVGGAILTLTREIRADLIVMGCYGHAPSRERLFGGATRSVLASLPAPVLTSH